MITKGLAAAHALGSLDSRRWHGATPPFAVCGDAPEYLSTWRPGVQGTSYPVTYPWLVRHSRSQNVSISIPIHSLTRSHAHVHASTASQASLIVCAGSSPRFSPSVVLWLCPIALSSSQSSLPDSSASSHCWLQSSSRSSATDILRWRCTVDLTSMITVRRD